MLRELRQELREIRETLDPHSNLLTFILDIRRPGDDRPDEGGARGPNDIVLDMRGPKTNAEMANDADQGEVRVQVPDDWNGENLGFG